ncbi:pilus assembly protein TadD [Cupriavidus taiwanensis]|uniref:Putative type II secretion system protein, contains TPR repeats [Intracellular trafficking and secretion] n=1 Tax=Cupriavidus taiwanensis TaxID=164546 RepID=A0A7Z7JBZ6_9BURK|nr:pilus assembly protein TadD [Cupriavidus taiwanensis]SOZ09461.1 putative type II secretion system protein, contains TPR repeats [Intracellular trafficking and secretion] [Cupriavidus taiwanensis]SOZ11584.1 putative type II secretion system protein, contains TPR repeats [Intracellular trafficking and secretion] [Cupriavidus taiwanensis]SOZ42939.1 putative type II secretion system protein, contains TPR repeats [Intracellular trafficking and secretion] [Cupriavidus taiwanensis]SPC22186.1 putati
MKGFMARPAAAACVLMAVLSGCAAGNNAATAMHDQAEAQVELARLRDKTARAEYSEQAVYLGLIRKMQQDGLYFASLAHIEVYVQRFGAGPEIQVMRADALRETGQDQAAIEAYQALAAAAKGTEAAHAHHGLGLLAGRQDDFARAVTELRAAAALDPVNARIASDLGYALMRAGALQDARVPVMQALELDARNPRVISNAVVWLMADGKRAQANAMMQKAALPEPTRSAIRKEADRIARAAAARDRPAARPGQPKPTSAPAAVAVVAKPIAIAAQAGATP